jgi:DNA-3-methyladenine glycosylase I
VAGEKVQVCWGLVGPLDAAYHDEEWGVPCHDDRDLFERLILEGFQAGLSWTTILKKRENFRRAFEGFEPERIARYGPDDVARLMADAGIVRNRLKVEGAVKNARAFLAIVDEAGSFDRYAWAFTGGGTLDRPTPRAIGDVPATTPESDALSKDLKRRGFTFVGSTICYAFMQSVGMVNDHLAGCAAGERLRGPSPPPLPTGVGRGARSGRREP